MKVPDRRTELAIQCGTHWQQSKSWLVYSDQHLVVSKKYYHLTLLFLLEVGRGYVFALRSFATFARLRAWLAISELLRIMRIS